MTAVLGGLAWLLVLLAGVALLGRARPPLRPLPPPAPAEAVPPYILVCPGEPPSLEPAPRLIVADLDALPPGPARVLILGSGVGASPDLPRRLVACGADLVSVLPAIVGTGTAPELWMRDFARPARVCDVSAPEAFADERCAWLRRADLDLPGVGTLPVLRAARARKAHALAVELRGGLDLDGTAAVAAPSLGWETFRARLADLTQGDVVLRLFLGALPLLLLALTAALLAYEPTRATAGLSIAIGALGRAWRATQHRAGLLQVVAGLWDEARLALAVLRTDEPAPAPFPALPSGPAPRLTGPQTPLHGLDERLDASAVMHLARRQGGSATVMEQLYCNRPSGRTRLGRTIDRWVHASAGARALRHRRLLVAQLGRGQVPASLVSVPCGSARDAAEIGAPRTVLVDPDPAARLLAQGRLPAADLVAGTVETTPAGPFDLALYVGLAEYLDDADVVRHLTLLRARLGPTGALLTSTTAPHPDQRIMAERLGWRTRARRPEAFAGLLDAAGFRVEQRLADVLCVQWVFLARPIGQRGSGPQPAVSTN